MKIEKGKRYKTRGGWLAECIFDGVDHSYCIHSNIVSLVSSPK